MFGPKCDNRFTTFRTNGLLHLGPNFTTFRTKFLLHLGPLLHLGTFITFEASTRSQILYCSLYLTLQLIHGIDIPVNINGTNLLVELDTGIFYLSSHRRPTISTSQIFNYSLLCTRKQDTQSRSQGKSL